MKCEINIYRFTSKIAVILSVSNLIRAISKSFDDKRKKKYNRKYPRTPVKIMSDFLI
jgi:hypothetical protein